MLEGHRGGGFDALKPLSLLLTHSGSLTDRPAKKEALNSFSLSFFAFASGTAFLACASMTKQCPNPL